MSKRVSQIASHLSASLHESSTQPVSAQPTSAKADRANDVVIVSALRTAIGKAGKGKFAKSFPEDMLAPVLKAVVDEVKLKPSLVGDIVVGSVLGQGSQRANECRIAAFFAGFPETVPIHTVNRQCSSGLQALAHVAANIKAGYYDIGIAAGVEHMSSGAMGWNGDLNPRIVENDKAASCLIPMGITSENVAERYKISRKEQDELAVLSHQRAAKAIKSGRFKDEIVPVHVTVKDPKNPDVERKVVVDTDEGVRAETTFEGLSKLRAAFKDGGSTTAGNASQVSDGAAAVLAMRRSTAEKLGLPVLGVFRGFAVSGVDPAVMGIGPAFAIPDALKNAGLKISDIDLFEINEAFASQATYTVNKLGLSWDKVNVNGGAIALGHPLGCTGARMTASLLHEMKKRKARYGIVSMCIGSGMGAAGVFERE